MHPCFQPPPSPVWGGSHCAWPPLLPPLLSCGCNCKAHKIICDCSTLSPHHRSHIAIPSLPTIIVNEAAHLRQPLAGAWRGALPVQRSLSLLQHQQDVSASCSSNLSLHQQHHIEPLPPEAQHSGSATTSAQQPEVFVVQVQVQGEQQPSRQGISCLQLAGTASTCRQPGAK